MTTVPTPPAAMNLPETKSSQECRLKDLVRGEALLDGRAWVAIEYKGQRYRLQSTRAGKLILTK